MPKLKSVEFKPDFEAFAKIKVIGVGGSGGSAVNRMVRSQIRGVDFIAVNTDAQALNTNLAEQKIQIGLQTTRGLGAGMDPDVGTTAAEESEEQIRGVLEGADMVFITCGLGGGTGSGASWVIADVAKSMGILTIAVVTKPFSFEGVQRRTIAERSYEKLREKVDTIISIPNDKLLQVIDKKTSLLDAFAIVDEVLKQGVQGVADIITLPALINVDFADVKAIMKDAGSALMGIGRASGEDRAIDAARSAIDSPLLELSIKGARGVLFTIAGGSNLTMFEVNAAAELITASVDNNAKIIFGAAIDESLGEDIKITVIATGFTDAPRRVEPEPNDFKVANKTMIPEVKPMVMPMMKPMIPTIMPSRSESMQPFSKGVFTKKAAVSPIKVPTTPDTPTIIDDSDDLEVPTFIRKKMGK